ncbi:MAG TPA: efflux RND transporter periplasmic adaptor subunit [Minicystis sp.]|nr:efflux RND transporter periplasmic adaptor subunit [Minicystis sp.]
MTHPQSPNAHEPLHAPIAAPPPAGLPAEPAPRRGAIPLVIGGAVFGVLLVGGALIYRAEAQTNKVALASAPKPVTVTTAKSGTYRPSRVYVGTLEPWVMANIGPQLVSAYVSTVLVRPGAVVKQGEVLATLDCRNANAATQAVAAQARAVDARLKAIADESARYNGLLDGGFVAQNEAEQKQAQRSAEEAELNATRAKLAGKSLEVNDCVLRAPFDGEVATRTTDPGAFVHPGTAIVSVVDRSTIRLSADAPEVDFDAIAPGTPVKIHVLANGHEATAAITRRAPSADPSTRTVHFEIDITDPKRVIPVNTTAEVHIDVGKPVSATEVPLFAASIRGTKATLFVVENGVAHSKTVPVKGETGGSLFVDGLPAGVKIVTEGRALLQDGDRVTAKEEAAAAPAAALPAEGVPAATTTPAASSAPTAPTMHAHLKETHP